MNNDKILEKLSETVDALNNVAKSQVVLSDALLKQRENDNQQNEAFIILARAAENNSLANVNLSKAILKDKELLNSDLMERIVNILENQLNK